MPFTEAPFKIYNASAGAGKTYNLVRAYLRLCLGTPGPEVYRSILAVTFTNKAAGEMKARILKALWAFNKVVGPEKASPNEMHRQLAEELNEEVETLGYRAGDVLRAILHSYSAFSVSTIDKFTNRLIRSFAQDLKLNGNYEVELDSYSILHEAVDKMLGELQEGDGASMALISYINTQLEEGKSPRIAQHLTRMGASLFDEAAQPYLDLLQGTSLEEIIGARKQLLARQKKIAGHLAGMAEAILERMEEADLAHEWFSRKVFPNWLLKFRSKSLEDCFPGKMVHSFLFEEAHFFSKANQKKYGHLIDPVEAELRASAIHLLQELQSHYPIYHLSRLVLKDVYALAVLNLVDHRLQEVKEESNRLPIGEFNKLISLRLRQQAAPFLYERLGDRYKHFFIDEFQDTSSLQWENLIPLINNALSEGSMHSSAMLVGDGKQAIYRWRGGEVEQFLALGNNTHPSNKIRSEQGDIELYTRQKLTLAHNYRSRQEVVRFNNSFFKWIAGNLEADQHKQLYAQASQKANPREGGFVQLERNAYTDTYEEMELQRIEQAIYEAEQHGYGRSDIAILVRGNKEGKKIVDHLLSKDVLVVSTATLQLQQSRDLLFVIDFLRALTRPDDLLPRVKCLEYMWGKNEKLQDETLHVFLLPFKEQSIKRFEQFIETQWPGFDFARFQRFSLEQKVYTIINHQDDALKNDAFVSAFLDAVHRFQNQQEGHVPELLSWWDEEGGRKQLDMEGAENAVNLLTIHKSKGLEFPVVIMPFADWRLSTGTAHAWLRLDPGQFFGLPVARVSLSKNGYDYADETYKERYLENAQAEILDNVNLLYVAMTRAEEVLYIFSSTARRDDTSRVSTYFAGFLENEGAETPLQAGEYPHKQQAKPVVFRQISPRYKEEEWAKKLAISITAPKAWETGEQGALQFGKAVHAYLSTIEKSIDYNQIEEGDPLVSEHAEKVLKHPDLFKYFAEGLEVLNERDLLLPDGKIMRPDRVVLEGNTAHVLDYKTGAESPEHLTQLKSYLVQLKNAGYHVGDGKLVYINEHIYIKSLNHEA